MYTQMSFCVWPYWIYWVHFCHLYNPDDHYNSTFKSLYILLRQNLSLNLEPDEFEVLCNYGSLWHLPVFPFIFHPSAVIRGVHYSIHCLIYMLKTQILVLILTQQTFYPLGHFSNSWFCRIYNASLLSSNYARKHRNLW